MEPNEGLPISRIDFARIENRIVRIERKVNAIGVTEIFLLGAKLLTAKQYRGLSECEKNELLDSHLIMKQLKNAFYPEEQK